MCEMNTETERQNVFLIQYSNSRLPQNTINSELKSIKIEDKELTKNLELIKNNNKNNLVALAGKRISSEQSSINENFDIIPKTQVEIDGKAPGRWTEKEHNLYLEGLKLYGKNWKKIEEHIGTRSSTQIRSHDQKYMIKALKRSIIKTSPPRQEVEQPEQQKFSENEKESIKETPSEMLETHLKGIQQTKINTLEENRSINYLSNSSYIKDYSFETECPMISLNRLFHYFSSLPIHEAYQYLNDLKILGNSFKYMYTIKLNLTRKILEKIEFDQMKYNNDFPFHPAKQLDDKLNSQFLETHHSNSLENNSAQGFKDCYENNSLNNRSRYCFKLVNEKYRNRLAALDQIKRKCFELTNQENHK